MEKRRYFLGLDIGTNSVGWAVVDPTYKLCTFRGKSLWGIRLFDSAQTAADRRLARSARRRLERRKMRIDWLQELFAEEISKKDPTFFIKLNNSRLHLEDKDERIFNIKYPLFADKDYTDIDYYKEYPTIFHLRKELIENKKPPYDARLVYLAIHNLIKHRGHFLFDGEITTENINESISDKIRNILKKIKLNFEVDNINEEDNTVGDEIPGIYLIEDINIENTLKTILKSSKSATEKSEELRKCFIDRQNKRDNAIVAELCKLMVGLKGDFSKIFNKDSVEVKENIKNSKISFNAEYDEEIKDLIQTYYPEELDVLNEIQAIYILRGEQFISDAKIKEYNEHHDRVRTIKQLFKKYLGVKECNKFFNSTEEKINYSNYVGNLNTCGTKTALRKTVKAEDLDKEIKKKLKGILENTEHIDEIDEVIIKGLIEETSDLLPIQRTTKMGSVPRQINEIELRAILENAEQYLPFLSECDENGISVKDKIISIFEYRIPYYVGPLGGHTKEQKEFAWMIRKEEGRIYPWNIEEKVDYTKTGEEFIKRMINKCTYLYGKDVIPKHSLLYQEFMVLNLINNIRLYDSRERISVEEKKTLFEEIFMNKTRVTFNDIYGYFKLKDKDLNQTDIHGIDSGDGHIVMFPTLSTYLDFKKQIFGDDIKKESIRNLIEEIVTDITIFGADKKRLKAVLEFKYQDKLTSEQYEKLKNNITKFNYKDWGTLSREFLNGVTGCKKGGDSETTIITALKDNNLNLQELLSDSYTFSEHIEKVNKGAGKDLSETFFEDYPISPANKRAVRQAALIYKEILKVMGNPPEKIFLEMARSEEINKTRTSSRKKKIEDLLDKWGNDEDIKKLRDELENIDNKDSRRLDSEKIYLYFIQKGRCMYSGEPIDLEKLSNTEYYDVDHIYPQSKIKDDSLDNKVLVKAELNRSKEDKTISRDIQNKMFGFWKELEQRGAITKEKLARLTKKEFSNEDLQGFLNRQLVDTRQVTKAVSKYFESISNSKVIYVKANLVSAFRHDEIKCYKSRRINDFHHGKDAYLNVVVGNVYNAKYTDNPRNWYAQKRTEGVASEKGHSLNNLFKRDVKRYVDGELVWEGYNMDEKLKNTGSIVTVKRIMNQDDLFYTEYTYCSKGQLFDMNPLSKEETTKIRIKKDLDNKKYGGYGAPGTAFFVFVEYGDNVQKYITGVPIYVKNLLKTDSNAVVKYLEEVRGLKEIKEIRTIKKNSLIMVDNFPMRIRGENDLKLLLNPSKELKIKDQEVFETLRKVEKFIEKLTKNKSATIDEKYDCLNNNKLDSAYMFLTNKLQEEYIKRPTIEKLVEILKDGEAKFKQERIEDKAKILSEILKLFDRKTNFADLLKIGGSGKSGACTLNKNTVAKKLQEGQIVLVHQSVTGIFEDRIKL